MLGPITQKRFVDRRRNLEHLDPGSGHLGPQRPRIGAKPRLAGAVDRGDRHRHIGESGGHIDDRRLRLDAEQREEPGGHPHRRLEVHLDLQGQVVWVQIRPQIEPPHGAGAVDQDVQRRKGVGELDVEFGDGRRGGDVADRDMQVGRLGLRRLQSRQPASNDDDGVVAGDELARQRQADAGGPAGDQDGRMPQSHGDEPSPVSRFRSPTALECGCRRQSECPNRLVFCLMLRTGLWAFRGRPRVGHRIPRG